MPKGDAVADSTFIRMLITGPSKVGKSHYAMQAAKAGFNLVYLDGDVAGPTLTQQPKEIKERIWYIDARDSYDGGTYVPRFSALLWAMITSSPFVWNDTHGMSLGVSKSKGLYTDDDAIWEMRLSQLDSNCVLVVDSLTALSQSIMKDRADQAGIDLYDIERAERGIYSSARNKIGGILAALRAARCHVILIAHPDEWEQRRKKPGQVKQMSNENEMIIVGTKQVPMTVSKPFGAMIAKDFTDAAWMSVSPMGQRMIDFTVSADRDAGGRFSDKGEVDVFSFEALCKKAGIPIPGKDNPLICAGIKELTGAEFSAMAPASTLQVPATVSEIKAIASQPKKPSSGFDLSALNTKK